MTVAYFLSREALAAHLDESLAALHAFAGQVGDDAWSRPTRNPAWSVHDTLAHLAASGKGLLATVQRFLEGRDLPANFSLDYWNERQVNKRRNASPRELLAEIEAAHAQAKHLLASLSAAQLATRGTHPAGRPLSVAGVLYLIAEHEWDHLQDMAAAVDMPLPRRASWQDPFRKDRLWWRLQDTRDQVKRLVARLSPDAWEAPVTDRWRVRDVVAHLAFAERGHVDVGWALLNGESTDIPGFDLDTFNNTEVDRRRNRPMAAILAELDAARAGTAALLAAVGPDDWEKGGPHPGGFTVTVEGIFKVIRVHEQRHLRDIQHALAGEV